MAPPSLGQPHGMELTPANDVLSYPFTGRLRPRHLPVNVRTSRKPSLSMIRQCRKATSEWSSFFSEKFTLNFGLGLVCGILSPHLRPNPGVSPIS